MVWIDCEMTGLDLGSDKLIEIAALVTDADLNILGDGVDVVIVDTAGRLHTQGDLMSELGKVRKVISRQLRGAPHTLRGIRLGLIADRRRRRLRDSLRAPHDQSCGDPLSPRTHDSA